MRKLWMWVVAIIVLLAVGVYGWRWHLISELRKPILNELTDPDSAVFRKDSFVGSWSGRGFYCGEVNGKNAMGGYVGYTGFLVWSGMSDEAPLHMIDNNSFNKSHIEKTCDDLRYRDKPWWYIRW